MPAAVNVPASIEPSAHFLLLYARLLLSYGGDTQRVVTRIAALSGAIGVHAELFVSSEHLMLTLSADGAMHTHIGHAVTGMGIDGGRFAAVEAIGDGLLAGMFDLDTATSQLEAVGAMPNHWPGWLVVLAIGGTAASLARLFGAPWSVVAAAFLAGVISTVLRRQFAGRGFNPIAATWTTAALSAATGGLALKAVPDVSAEICLVAAGMILVPGVPLINAISDIAFGHATMSLSRFATSFATIAAIGLGLFFAASVTSATISVSAATIPVPVLEDIAFSGLAAFGYAMLFNVPARAVPLCMLCGAIAHGGRTMLGSMGLDIGATTLVAAFAAGLLACWFGMAARLPKTTFAFPGVVAMIPGSYAFRGTLGALHIMAQGPEAPPALVAETLAAVMSAVVMTAAVAIGLLLGFALWSALRGLPLWKTA